MNLGVELSLTGEVWFTSGVGGPPLCFLEGNVSIQRKLLYNTAASISHGSSFQYIVIVIRQITDSVQGIYRYQEVSPCKNK